MNSTVAVALITSISTLAGASISGYIAFSISRSQAKNQFALARRQIRRDAYVQYLNQLSKVELALDTASYSELSATTGEFDDPFFGPLKDELNALRPLVDVVLLEGSAKFSSTARNMAAVFAREMAAMATCAKKSDEGAFFHQEDYDKVYKERRSKKAELIEAAQQDLSDTSL